MPSNPRRAPQPPPPQMLTRGGWVSVVPCGCLKPPPESPAPLVHDDWWGAGGQSGSVCPVLQAPLGRLGEPYAKPGRGETCQYAASRAQRHAAQLPHDCQGPGAAPTCGTTVKDPHSMNAMQHRWCCQNRQVQHALAWGTPEVVNYLTQFATPKSRFPFGKKSFQSPANPRPQKADRVGMPVGLKKKRKF